MSPSSLSHTHRLPLAPNSQINMLINQYTLPVPRKNQIAHFVMTNGIVNQIPKDDIYPSLVRRLFFRAQSRNREARLPCHSNIA